MMGTTGADVVRLDVLRPEVMPPDAMQPAAARPAAASLAPLPILYGFRRCPYAMRARLALAASGQMVEHREVLLRGKPPELLAASPKGTVPVLVLPGGEVIDESLDIMLWALGRHDPQQWLGSHGQLRTTHPTLQTDTLDGMLALIAQCDGPFKRHLDAYKYPPRHQMSPALAATPAELAELADPQTLARQQACGFIDVLDQRLTRNAFLFGPQLSLADAAILPFIRQFSGVQPDWFAQAPWPALRAWLDGITASALFASVMQKRVPWRGGVGAIPGGPFHAVSADAAPGT